MSIVRLSSLVDISLARVAWSEAKLSGLEAGNGDAICDLGASRSDAR